MKQKQTSTITTKRELAFVLVQLPGIGTTFDYLEVIWFGGKSIFQVLKKFVRGKQGAQQ